MRRQALTAWYAGTERHFVVRRPCVGVERRPNSTRSGLDAQLGVGAAGRRFRFESYKSEILVYLGVQQTTLDSGRTVIE